MRELKTNFEKMKLCNQMKTDMKTLHEKYLTHSFTTFEEKSADALNILD